METLRSLVTSAYLIFAFSLHGTAQSPSEVVLHDFAHMPNGENPSSGVVRDTQGNLYGTTPYGGTANSGVVYKLDPARHQTVLHTFTGGNDGGNPIAGVILDAARNLYGTASAGGPANAGLVYKINARGEQTVLYSFTGGTDGRIPWGGVTRDAAGNLFGTTLYGGANGWGVVYKLDPAGHETVVYSFTGGTDGSAPQAGVTLDSAGNLYGTTPFGGFGTSCAGPCGVVYKVDPSGQETVLHAFANTPDGAYPLAGVTLDASGNIYGTASTGGASFSGVVFKLSAASDYEVLYDLPFTDSNTGSDPSSIVLDESGNLYFATLYGGTDCAVGCGAVYELDAAGNANALHMFKAGPGGANPTGVIRDAAGNLYGTTALGGGSDCGGFNQACGVVFKLDPTGHETVLFSLAGGVGGEYPVAGVVLDGAGNLYGTTVLGGGPANAGTVYKLDSTGHEMVLYKFKGGADGANPFGGVILDASGNLYGTTTHGGALHRGVLYKLNTSGTQTVLHSFTGGADGANPYGALALDEAGDIYGTASAGGQGNCSGGCGLVYKFDTSGDLTVLYSFTGGLDGGGPKAGVVRDEAGNLYGTTTFGGAQGGVIFKVDAGGHETVLHQFSDSIDGINPASGVTRDVAGNLYGTTTIGGGFQGLGTVYKLDPTGLETVLHRFRGGDDGGDPQAGVVLDAAGNIYGTALEGANRNGVVYKMTPAGQEALLYTFTGGADGSLPYATVIRDKAGNLVGTTAKGGTKSGGVVFKIQMGAAAH